MPPAFVGERMIELAFALLDLRRLIHIAVAAAAIAAIHSVGPPGAKSVVDRLVVNPVTRAAQSFGRQFRNSTVTAQKAVGHQGLN